MCYAYYESFMGHYQGRPCNVSHEAAHLIGKVWGKQEKIHVFRNRGEVENVCSVILLQFGTLCSYNYILFKNLQALHGCNYQLSIALTIVYDHGRH